MGLKLPVKTSVEKCDCHQLYRGVLTDFQKGMVLLNPTETMRRYYDENGLAKQETTAYTEESTQDYQLSIPTDNLLAVVKYRKRRKTFKQVGSLLIVLSVVQGLAIGPSLNDDARSVSDVITLGAFGVGLTLLALPDQKTYYFEQPPNKKKVRLWRLKAE